MCACVCACLDPTPLVRTSRVVGMQAVVREKEERRGKRYAMSNLLLPQLKRLARVSLRAQVEYSTYLGLHMPPTLTVRTIAYGVHYVYVWATIHEDTTQPSTCPRAPEQDMPQRVPLWADKVGTRVFVLVWRRLAPLISRCARGHGHAPVLSSRPSQDASCTELGWPGLGDVGVELRCRVRLLQNTPYCGET